MGLRQSLEVITDIKKKKKERKNRIFENCLYK